MASTLTLSDLINQKKEIRIKAKVPFIDLNRAQVMVIFGVDIFGKDVRDEQVIQLIIDETTGIKRKGDLKPFKKFYESQVELYGKMKRDKTTGVLLNGKGQFVLEPKR